MFGTSPLNLIAVATLLGVLPNVIPSPRHVLHACSGSAIRVAGTQDPRARAAKLRARFINKLAPYLKNADKHAKKDETYRIGVVGKDLLADAIYKHLPSKPVGKRRIQVASFRAKAAATATACKFDLLYVASTIDAAKLTAIIKAHEKLGTILICEQAGFAKAGGGIQLFVSNNKIQFEVNHVALKRQGVRISPQLLKLSTKGPTKGPTK